MTYKELKKKEDGFTIIEVLIVLAIAGLIMLIVFLAVPALQRNQRNEGRKADVGRIGGAVSEFYSNNNGTVPSTAAHRTTIVNSVGNMSQYVAADIQNIVTSNQAALANVAQVRIVTGAKCDTATPGATTNTNASTRSVAIQYMIETSGAATPSCQEV